MIRSDSDGSLLRDFLSGQREALGELAQRHERSMLGLARGLLDGSNSAAEEAVQETWLRLIRFGGSFNGRSSFKTWLYAMLVNRCYDLRQRDGRTRRHAALIAAKEKVSHEISEQLEEADRSRALRESVEALPEERRVVLLLCYHAGMTHGQAAAILEIPLGTLKSRLHAALGELRERLGTEPDHAAVS